MHVRIAKTSVPFGSLLLLFVISATYLVTGDSESFLRDVRGSEGWFCGPCTSLYMSECGQDVPFSECKYDSQNLRCVTIACDDYCPHGGRHESCAGIIWTCTQTYPPCNILQVRKCKPYFYGPPDCRCTTTTGAACGIRADC
jgi:hypothetical protein